jgi:sulfite exporter TauE/SafE
MEIIISALILGAMGSFHCAGMCGPIALSLPLRGNTITEKIWGGILYNLGRTLVYGLMGAVFGALGQGFRIAGIQQGISLVMGILMVLSVFLPSLFNRMNLVISEPISGSVRRSIQRLFEHRSYGGLFLIGSLNALLPCGLVYMAIAGSIGTGSIVNGALFMIIFGLGTIPMMLSISLIGNIINRAIRNRINRVIPYMIVIIGLIFILRGLSLGIPYLSPPAEKLKPAVHMNMNEEKKM